MQNLKGEFKELALDSLHISESHERSVWELGSLAADIKENGIKVHLIVRRRPRSLGGYEILDGARRRKAAEKAGAVKAPCLVVEVDDATAIAMQLDANDKRVPLHPVDEAAIFARLAALGWDDAAIAKRFQRKRPEITRRLRLNGLAPKARAAFVDGLIDEDGALALARIEPKKQAEYIAAVDAGTLCLEEVASTVNREQSASLEDVPWRISDEKLVPKAGACSACPKRSSVQRDLFAEVAGDRCLDVACFRGKMDAVYAIEVAKTPKADVLRGQGARADELFLPEPGRRPSLLTNSGYVDAEALCPHVKGLTWGKALAKATLADGTVPLKLARDQDGRPRFLLQESAVAKLVRKSDAAKEQREASRAADPVTSDAESDAAREAARVRSAQIAAVYEAALSGDHDVLGWIVERIIDAATGKTAANAVGRLESASKGEDVKATEDPKAWLRDLAARSKLWAKRVALAILIREADEGDALPEALVELAKVVGADLKAAAKKARKAEDKEGAEAADA